MPVVVIVFLVLVLGVGYVELAKERAALVASWSEACAKDNSVCGGVALLKALEEKGRFDWEL